ncbi:hypothetical protein AVEN_155404-1 [Araneus ventricosus]|uniref:Uncharacterized protein n=1 Tax=Araneus ventricosus TaxID=182803 RepID=A0A4Y2RCN3_ARAVE|nr:hypothetical protein AVEN_155404-1 [Araneus ventricosus]
MHVKNDIQTESPHSTVKFFAAQVAIILRGKIWTTALPVNSGSIYLPGMESWPTGDEDHQVIDSRHSQPDVAISAWKDVCFSYEPLVLFLSRPKMLTINFCGKAFAGQDNILYFRQDLYR